MYNLDTLYIYWYISFSLTLIQSSVQPTLILIWTSTLAWAVLRSCVRSYEIILRYAFPPVLKIKKQNKIEQLL